MNPHDYNVRTIANQTGTRPTPLQAFEVAELAQRSRTRPKPAQFTIPWTFIAILALAGWFFGLVAFNAVRWLFLQH